MRWTHDESRERAKETLAPTVGIGGVGDAKAQNLSFSGIADDVVHCVSVPAEQRLELIAAGVEGLWETLAP
jgi:hypothetical protein